MEEMLPPENPMGTAKISGLVLKTGLPLMISLLINSLYNFVDSVFVARISEDALTALSLAAPIQIIMSAMGLGIGCTVGSCGDETIFQMAVRRSRNHYGIWNPIPANLYAGFAGYDGTMGI